MQQLTGVVQNYAWGTTDAIPELLGREITDEPQAEYWLGAHSSAPATLADGRSLEAAIAADPSVLGDRSRETFGNRLPFLLKVLSAAKPLSLQVHPSRSQAERGFAAEESAGIDRLDPRRNYRDNWPKPEAIVARSPFVALCGFSTPETSTRVLNLLNAPIDLVALLSEEDPLRRTFMAALELDHGQIGKVIDTAHTYADAGGETGRDARMVLHIAQEFPDDPGIVAALLLNRIELLPGQALFLGAGNVHAYLSGTGIEVMANSDNVLRGGLTPKHVDSAELGALVNFHAEEPTILTPVPVAHGVHRFPTPAPEFALWQLDAPAANLPGAGSARILLTTDGDLQLTDQAGHSLRLNAGEAAFIAASEDITVGGTGAGFLAAPGT